MTKQVLYHIVFRGDVQGVGFRFTARELALRYGVRGWVRNNPDGTVECEVEGDSRMIAQFLDDLKEYFRENLTDAEVQEREPVSTMSGFKVRF